MASVKTVAGRRSLAIAIAVSMTACACSKAQWDPVEPARQNRRATLVEAFVNCSAATERVALSSVPKANLW